MRTKTLTEKLRLYSIKVAIFSLPRDAPNPPCAGSTVYRRYEVVARKPDKARKIAREAAKKEYWMYHVNTRTKILDYGSDNLLIDWENIRIQR